MSDQKILGDLHSAISSPESAGGAERSSSQDGVQIDQSGLGVRHASHSQPQEKERERTTHGISGQSSSISSASAILQQSLASRLQQLSDTGGSMIYKLTLKEKVTPAQRSYYQLAASAPRTKGTDSSSWLTPTTSDMNGVRKIDGKRSGGLNTQAHSAWPTPIASDNGERGTFDSGSVQRRIEKGKSIELSMMVHSAWPTPAARDGKDGAAPSVVNSGRSDKMAHCVHLIPWATPTATDHSRGTKPPRPQDTGIPLTQQVSELKPWATPNTMDHMKLRSDEALLKQATVARKGRKFPANLREQVDPRSQEIYASGKIPQLSTAEMESTAPSQLNPRFSLWLMGYPIEWAYCAERVTPSSRKRQRKS